jgi:hypothetical protein
MKVRQLDANERAGMAAERAWTNDLLAGFGSNVRLTATKQDIPTIHSLLDNGPYTENVAGEVEILGGIFGDIIATEFGMSWVVIEDEEGTCFALQYRAEPIFIFPRSMILKRVEDGDDIKSINLEVMLENLCRAIEAQTRAR